MSSLTATALSKLVVKLGLLNSGQVEECQHEAEPTENPEPLLRVMERKGYLTPLQIDRLLKGESTGYFLGGYRILYKIASGSFGRVFRADDPSSGRVVAIKVLRRRWSDDPANVELFEREGRVGMSLRHPGIVEILNIGHDQVTSQYFIVMEFIEGGNLRDLLAIRKRFDPREALRLMEDLASALSYAYGRGVTHRDIKLTNVLISTTGQAKLVDFGLAQIYESRARSFRLSDEDEEMHVQRTVDYAALEKAANVKSGDTRSDIFFLGCVLFEMLTGRSPIPVTHRSERGNPRRFQNIEPMKAEEVNAPPIVFRLVETMMQLDPAKRYQTPKLLVEAIKKARQELEGGVSDGQLIVERPAVSIFVVEADERLQDTIRDKLKKLGYKVFIAKDPARALERFYQHPFEGLIIDAGTTGREGAMTFKELMERARLRQLPLRGILILSESQADVASEFLPTPSIAILIRPLKLGQLVHKVEDFWPRTPQASATKEPDSAPAAD